MTKFPPIQCLALLISALLIGCPAVSQEDGQKSSPFDTFDAEAIRIELLPLAGAESQLPPNTTITILLSLKLDGLAPGDEVFAAPVLRDRGSYLFEFVPRETVEVRSKIEQLRMSYGSLQAHTFGLVKGDVEFLRFARARLDAYDVSVVGTPGRGGISVFTHDQQGFPVHIGLPMSSMMGFVRDVVVGEEEGLPEGGFNINDDEAPGVLSMSYLTTASGDAEVRDVRLTLKTPKVPFAYDEIALIPFVIRRLDAETAIVHTAAAEMPPLFLAAAPIDGATLIPQPEVRDPVASAHIDTPIRLVSAETTPLLVGRPANVVFEAEFEDLSPGTEVFIALQPAVAEEDRVFGVSGDAITETVAGNMAMTICRSEAETGLMRIRDDPIVVRTPGLLLPDFEAGFLGTAQSEKGTVRGALSFVPPPLQRWYTTVRATPIAVEWPADASQPCARAVFDASRSIDLPIAGRN